MEDRYYTFELSDRDFPLGLFDILKGTNGYFVGNIKFEAVQLPHMGLSNSIDMSNHSTEEFGEKVVQADLGTYSLIKDQPMVIIAKSLAKRRLATIEEIYDDVDKFGEQVFWPKEYYAKVAKISVDEIDYDLVQTFKFPEGSFMSGEEYIYSGPERWSEFIYATFVDQFPTRVPLKHIGEIIDDLNPKDKLMGDGGYEVYLVRDGLSQPLQYVRKHEFGEDILNPRSIDDINLDLLNDGVEKHIQQNLGLIKANKKQQLDHYKSHIPHLFEEREDGFMEKYMRFGK